MLFIDNKYSQWYQSIILGARLRTLPVETYTECHHIVPRCLGGSNSKENLVALTAREHFIVHLLLIRMVDGKSKAQMVYAAWQQSRPSKYKSVRITNRVYETLRKQLSESYKGREFFDETKRRIGAKSKGRKPMLGKKHTESTKKKISAAKIGVPLPKTEETKRKMSLTWKLLSPDRSGEKNPMFGKTQKDSTKELISLANSGRKNGMFGKYKNSPTIICPHCGRSGKKGPNFVRWHFDNCKENK